MVNGTNDNNYATGFVHSLLTTHHSRITDSRHEPAQKLRHRLRLAGLAVYPHHDGLAFGDLLRASARRPDMAYSGIWKESLDELDLAFLRRPGPTVEVAVSFG
jgi:hypothetical protein